MAPRTRFQEGTDVNPGQRSLYTLFPSAHISTSRSRTDSPISGCRHHIRSSHPPFATCSNQHISNIRGTVIGNFGYSEQEVEATATSKTRSPRAGSGLFCALAAEIAPLCPIHQDLPCLEVMDLAAIETQAGRPSRVGVGLRQHPPSPLESVYLLAQKPFG
jgi:hypothetical protein